MLLIRKKNYLWVHYQSCWKHNPLEEIREQKLGGFYYVSKIISISYLVVLLHLKQGKGSTQDKNKPISVSLCQKMQP